jgi:chemotaxis protein MotB
VLVGVGIALLAWRGDQPGGSVATASPSATPSTTATPSFDPDDIGREGSGVQVEPPGFTLDVTGASIVKSPRALVLTPDRGFFESGRTLVSPEGEDMLRDLAAQLRGRTADLFVVVSGRTDAVPVTGPGFFSDNISLGMARAVSAVEFLRRQPGMPYQIFAATTADGDQPVDTNTTEAGRARNRTVVIEVMKVVETSR